MAVGLATGVGGGARLTSGAWLAQRFNPNLLWGLYFASVGYLLYRMVHPRFARKGQTVDTRKATLLVISIAIYSTMLGVGVGFLLVPTLIALGLEPKRAAGTNTLPIAAGIRPCVPGRQRFGVATPI